MLIVSLILLSFFHATVWSFGYHVVIKNDGPVVLGANITFRAEVRKNDVPQQGTYLFKWRDNMKPNQNKFEEKRQGISTWTISHSPKKNYTSGTHEVQVDVFTESIIEWILCVGTESFTLEDHLVGNLILDQRDAVIETYVSTEYSVQHLIKLHGPDNEYLKSNANNYNIQWFVDGNLTATYKNLSGLSWNHQFREPDVSRTITVTIVAVRKTSNSSSSLESSTKADSANSTNSLADLKLNNTSDPSFAPFSNLTNSTTCQQKTQVCGSFSKKVTVKAPIKGVNIAGNNWLKHGDMLNLKVTCNGSAVFNFCKRFFVGSYKVIGNETCKYPPEMSANCDFSVDHYFRDSKLYTVLLIITNDVSQNITAVGVNIYEVTKHPQLSVIVVPLTASILAIILIIFGIAFYFQNRNSYAIEVADFDFTNNNDLEYKTFKERLAEAIHNAFNKPEDFSEEDSYNGVPSTSNKKYGSMQ